MRIIEIIRFSSKIDLMGPMSPAGTRCHVWKAGKDLDGYGIFSCSRKSVRAHRIAFELEYGKASKWVLHHCDNPSCVNPDHLFEGSAQDNSSDCRKKDRTARRERNGRAKLSMEVIAKIRSEFFSGKAIRQLTREHPVCRRQIQRIVRGNHWNNEAPPILSWGAIIHRPRRA